LQLQIVFIIQTATILRLVNSSLELILVRQQPRPDGPNSRRKARSRARTARRGTTALEFAIVVTPLLVLVLGAMEIGYDFFVDMSLDNAVHTAARSVQIGTSVRQSNQTIAQFMQASVCPNLGSLLDCANLYVSVVSVPSGSGQNYRTYLAAHPLSLTSITSATNVICTGVAGQMMLLQAYYLSPTFLGLLVPGFSVWSPVNPGQRVHATYAAAGFINEYFSGGETGC
jgi:Flp pilus assembly protein TadG